MRKISFVAVLLLFCAAALHAAPGGGTPTPLPPSAVVFSNTTLHFNAPTDTFTASVSAPADGAWLTGSAKWSTDLLFGWDCSHSYTADLSPNNNDYAPLFIAGWSAAGICANEYPVYGCLNCGIDWGGVKNYQYMTTDNSPGFLAPGGGTVTLRTNNGGGQDDHLTIYVQQVNRDAMVNMTIFQSDAVDDPSPADSTEVQSRYFIANTADRVPVVPVFHYGVTSTGADVQYPAGPSVTYLATWDTGQTSTPDIAFAPAAKTVHGHTILGVPIPKMATGSHTFTIKATLPSGKTYTSPSMTVFVYAQVIYLTYGTAFNPKNPTDDLPKFVPGQDANGNNVDLRNGPQSVQLNIIIPKGSSGTFNIHLDPTHYPGIAMNYPLSGADTNPDIDFGGLSTDQNNVPIPKGGGTKVYSVPLQIHDYAGAATIEVTMPYRKTTFTARRRIPLDDDNNGLPDAGWTATGGTHIDTAGLQATGDVDVAGGSIGADAAVTGDGLSNFEEFRGFFTAGTYARLNPREKDIFVDIDPAFLLNGSAASPVAALTTLTPRIHYLDPTEVQGTDLPSRAILRAQAVVDFNRATVPVAHPRSERAVRLVYQTSFYPAVHLAGPNIDVPVWEVGYLGATLSDDILDIDVLNAPGNVATINTPMRTQFSEEYTRTFTNLAVNTTFSYPYHYDANGNVVPQCTFQGQSGCDVWDTTNLLIIPSLQDNAWGFLYTVPDPGHDPVEHYSLQARNCGSDTAVLGGLNSLQMERLKGFIAAHEMGHAMHMDHLRSFVSDCGDLMFDTEASAPHRQAMSNYLPQPSGFSTKDQAMIRLWEP